MVLALLRERERIEEAAARGEPEFETYIDSRTGNEHRRRARGLSRASINKVLDGVERVLREAKRRKLIEQLPDTRELRVRGDRPSRLYLELDQALQIIDAARAFEEKHRGLTWEDVHAIRESPASNVALARRYRVSDVLIGRFVVGRSGRARPNAAVTTSRGPLSSRRCSWPGYGSRNSAGRTASTLTCRVRACACRV